MPTVAVPQVVVEDLATEANRDRIAARVSALDDDVSVALFPEYALTGFVSDGRIHDAALDRETVVGWLEPLAADADLALLVGYVERDGEERYNATAYVAPDGSTTVYRKRHLWADERNVLTPGRRRVVVDTPAGPTGLLTCFDLNFVADSAAFTRDRVDALFVVGAWPAAHSENWRLLLRARALDGVRWVVGAGRTGRRQVADATRQVYAGQSMVVRPDGRVAASLGRGERDLVYDLDREVLESQRKFIPVYEDA